MIDDQSKRADLEKKEADGSMTPAEETDLQYMRDHTATKSTTKNK